MKATKVRSIAVLHTQVIALLAATAGGALVWQTAWAQSEDFNSGSAPGWTHYDVGDIGAVAGIPGLGATYTFPSDGNGGFGYRIHSPPDAPYDEAPYGFGPSRALGFRPDVVYSGRFSFAVDLIAWNNDIDQAFGPTWFIHDIGPGSTRGYSFTWEPVGKRFLISQITDEQPVYLARLSNIVLDPTQRFRFLVTSHDGTTFLGQVFNTTDLDTPVGAAITSDNAYPAGIPGLLVFDGTSPSAFGADATFDNYNASVPAANTLRATVAHVSPASGEKAKQFYPTNVIAILDRDTTVDTNSILLWLDGNLAPSGDITISPTIVEPDNPAGMPNSFNGAMVTYPIPTLFPIGSRHTNSVAFQDSTAVWKTNTWSWVSDYPLLRAANSLPLGSFPFRGWNVRTVWTNGPGLGNSLARAERQLAIPPQIPALLNTQMVVQVLNWNDAGDGTDPSIFGNFTDPALFISVPGLAPDGSHENIACEVFAYLELTAGLHHFGTLSDDGFEFRSGNGLNDTNALVLGFSDGDPFNGRFDFMVEATGLYPVRCVWYENTGGADFQMFSAAESDPNSLTLLNDPNDPADVVKAYVPLRLLSSTSPVGPFATEPTAVIDILNRTVSVPMAGPAKFYKLQAPYPVTLTGVTKSGNNIVMSY